MPKNYEFDHFAVIEKKVIVKGCKIPEFYKTDDLAFLDIEMIIEYHQLYDKIPEGRTTLEAKIIYEMRDDGRYYPNIGKPILKNINAEDEKLVQWKLGRTYTFWQALKFAFRILLKGDLDGSKR